MNNLPDSAVAFRVRDKYSRNGSHHIAPARMLSAEFIERAKSWYALYCELGTLDAVGARVGVSRERVRQVIADAERAGFISRPTLKPLERDVLIEGLRRFGTIDRLAKKWRLPQAFLERNLRQCGITADDIKDAKRAREAHVVEVRRRILKREFERIARTLGRTPTVGDLTYNPEWRAFYCRIHHLFSGIREFREYCGMGKDVSSGKRYGEVRFRLSGIAEVVLAEMQKFGIKTISSADHEFLNHCSDVAPTDWRGIPYANRRNILLSSLQNRKRIFRSVRLPNGRRGFECIQPIEREREATAMRAPLPQPALCDIPGTVVSVLSGRGLAEIRYDDVDLILEVISRHQELGGVAFEAASERIVASLAKSTLFTPYFYRSPRATPGAPPAWAFRTSIQRSA